jgi:hypothetical protein
LKLTYRILVAESHGGADDRSYCAEHSYSQGSPRTDHLRIDSNEKTPGGGGRSPEALKRLFAPVVDGADNLKFKNVKIFPCEDENHVSGEYEVDAVIKKTGRPYRQLYGGRLIGENGKIKLLREFCDTVEVARAMFPQRCERFSAERFIKTNVTHYDKNTRTLLIGTTFAACVGMMLHHTAASFGVTNSL